MAWTTPHTFPTRPSGVGLQPGQGCHHHHSSPRRTPASGSPRTTVHLYASPLVPKLLLLAFGCTDLFFFTVGRCHGEAGGNRGGQRRITGAGGRRLRPSRAALSSSVYSGRPPGWRDAYAQGSFGALVSPGVHPDGRCANSQRRSRPQASGLGSMGPILSRLCPPAAAISSTRLALSCPLISLRSG